MNTLSDHERPQNSSKSHILGRLDRDFMLGIFKVERGAGKLGLDIRRHDVTLTGMKSAVQLYHRVFAIITLVTRLGC